MTYKVPYITAKMIFITDKKTQKMLVSPSDFSTHPARRVLWEELLVLSRFHSENYEQTSGMFVYCVP